MLESGDTRIMIDCGLAPGEPLCGDGKLSNRSRTIRRPSPRFLSRIRILDHIGRLPSLVKAGFTGTIYATPATKDFAELMLYDSEHLLLAEAEREKKPPLYNDNDITAVLAHVAEA